MRKMLSVSMKLSSPYRHWRGHLLPVGSAISKRRATPRSNYLENRTAAGTIGRCLSGTRSSTENKRDGIASLVESLLRSPETGALLYDARQLQVATRFDALRKQLRTSDMGVLPSDQLTTNLFSDAEPKGIFERIAFVVKRTIGGTLRSNTTPRGIYIHGSVGSGKSFLMDLFYRTIADDEKKGSSMVGRRKIVRWHFHEFMLEVHSRIHHFNQQQQIRDRARPQVDAVSAVALSFAQEARILCLDEFQVTDIADAMILKRLFTMLWGDGSRVGMVVVATSNRHPNDLYEGGLNRSLFVPFLGVLHRHMELIEMDGKQDYRRISLGSSNTSLAEEKSSTVSSDPSLQQFPPEGTQKSTARQVRRSYFSPSDSAETRRQLEAIFCGERGGDGGEENPHREIRIPVRMGRHVVVPRSNCSQTIGWFDFDSLCAQPLGAADYWAICEHYSTVIVDHVPRLDASRFNEARRFVTLIDALYESKTRLVLAAQVPLDQLLVHFEATVETQDGDEEIASSSLDLPNEDCIKRGTAASSDYRNEMMFVEGKGGSSSSAATTMIRTRDGGSMEWSATGRIGVSLAQLSTVREVSFSFKRAESRLVEMTNSPEWGR